MNKFKKIISKLYERYCVTDSGAFFIEKKTFSKEDELNLFNECEIMLRTGALNRVVDMVYAESESKQLSEWIEIDQKYYKANAPVTTTYAEFERMERMGIETLMKEIQRLANKVPKPNPEFNKHEAI